VACGGCGPPRATMPRHAQRWNGRRARHEGDQDQHPECVPREQAEVVAEPQNDHRSAAVLSRKPSPSESRQTRPPARAARKTRPTFPHLPAASTSAAGARSATLPASRGRFAVRWPASRPVDHQVETDAGNEVRKRGRAPGRERARRDRRRARRGRARAPVRRGGLPWARLRDIRVARPARQRRTGRERTARSSPAPPRPASSRARPPSTRPPGGACPKVVCVHNPRSGPIAEEGATPSRVVATAHPLRRRRRSAQTSSLQSAGPQTASLKTANPQSGSLQARGLRERKSPNRERDPQRRGEAGGRANAGHHRPEVGGRARRRDG